MRNQLLHGYVLHQRPYRENSRLVNFLSVEYGRVDGVARQHVPPLYQSALLYASGKSGLKSFTKNEQTGAVHTLQGQALLAGFYLNELLVRLLPIEEQCTALVAAYSIALEGLSQLIIQADPHRALIEILRRFEWVLLQTLGYAVIFDHDEQGAPVEPDRYYHYHAGAGFCRSIQGESGATLLKLADASQMFLPDHLASLTRIFKRELALQLGDQPLKSRELWLAGRPSTTNSSSFVG
jgi:DNA repair protein RecO (recombination protein O)